jgi:hypothetical protein
MEVALMKPTVAYDVLEKIDVRIGTIELVEDIRGVQKLVRLTSILVTIRGRY